MELIEVGLPIRYVSENGPKNGKVSLLVPDQLEFLKKAMKVNPKNTLIEAKIRSMIQVLKGEFRSILNDTYRYLVVGNYTSIDGHKGYEAISVLDENYPDNETLPEFELKTIAFNTSGMILYNVLRYPELAQINYRILGALLITMVENGILGTPKMDLRQEQTKDFQRLIK